MENNTKIQPAISMTKKKGKKSGKKPKTLLSRARRMTGEKSKLNQTKINAIKAKMIEINNAKKARKAALNECVGNIENNDKRAVKIAECTGTTAISTSKKTKKGKAIHKYKKSETAKPNPAWESADKEVVKAKKALKALLKKSVAKKTSKKTTTGGRQQQNQQKQNKQQQNKQDQQKSWFQLW